MPSVRLPFILALSALLFTVALCPLSFAGVGYSLPEASASPGAASRENEQEGVQKAEEGQTSLPETTSEESRNDSPQNMLKQLLDGSLIGSVFFDMPYTGFNTVDLAVFLVIIYICIRSFLFKKTRLQPGRQTPGLPPDSHAPNNRARANREQDREAPGQNGYPSEPPRQSPPQVGPFDPTRGPSPWGRGGSPVTPPGDQTFPEQQRSRVRPEDLRPPAEYVKPAEDAQEDRGSDRHFSSPSGQKRAESPWNVADKEKIHADRPENAEEPATMKAHAAMTWQALSSKPGPDAESNEKYALVNLPDGFNAQEFMEGARLLYTRLQNSWAARDLNDVADFTTPEMLAIIEEQARRDPAPSSVQILLVEGKITGIERHGQEEIISVHFTTLLRLENRNGPTEVQEIWYFSRLLGLSDNWKLDGIEQA